MRRYLSLLLLLTIVSCSPAPEGMTEYTDSDFGFSFWYPTGWELKPVQNEKIFPGGKTIRTFRLQDLNGDWVTIWEVETIAATFTDTGGAGPFGSISYTYDPATKKWMMDLGDDNQTPMEARPRFHTIGGQPILPGTSRFNTSIIPISETKFVITNDGGTGGATYVAKTVAPTGARIDAALKSSTLRYFINFAKPPKKSD